ncbi:carboxypeptidase-like regulatory domain-containing protein [Cyclonatronum proteinivorum]|nr:carboxypeptidase-like regulatory domain-containing protein [Cyclonatronum proteinivorum]
MTFYHIVTAGLKIILVMYLSLSLSSCSQKTEANLTIISCIDQDGEILTGTAEVRINGVLHEIDCSAVNTISYKIAGDRIPLQFSGGEMPGYVLISPSETLPIGESGLEVELGFRSTANMIEIVINTCLDDNELPVDDVLKFTVDDKTYNINCPDGKRIFVEKDQSESDRGIEYAVAGEGFRYSGDGSISFREDQKQYYLTLMVESVANLSINNAPDAYTVALKNENENRTLFFEGQDYFEGLPTGRYLLEIEAEGFETLSETIELVRGDNAITFVSAPVIATGIINFDIIPETANVSVTSIATGEEFPVQSNDQSLALPVGDYSWTADADDYKSESGQIELRRGESNLNITLQPIEVMGELVVAVRPANANISVRNTSNNQIIQPGTNELLQLTPGVYEYDIELAGFNSRTGTVEIRPGSASSITATLSEVSILSFIDDMQQARSITDASRLLRSKPAQAPGLSAENRLRYHNELYRLAVILYEGGDIRDAVNVFEYLVSEDNANFQARLALGNHLVRSASNLNELTEAREFIRPMFGSMRFNYPPNDRQRVELTARYFYALSYYEQIRLTTDTDRMGVVARQAISQLRDVHARFSEVDNLSSDLQNYKNDTLNLIQVVEADILFGIN